MRADERRRLRMRREADLDAAAAAVLADPDANVDAELKRLETYERLLAIEDGRVGHKRLAAAAIGLICVTLVGLGQVVRMPATRVTMFAEAGTANFTLAGDWLWDASVSGSRLIRLGGFHEVDLPSALATQLGGEAADSFDFSGEGLSLASLNVGAGGRVTLETADGGAELFIKDAPVSGGLTLNGAVEVASGSNAAGSDWSTASLELVLPEIVTFAARPAGAVSAQVRIDREGEIELHDVNLTSLSFARERASGPGSVGFESTVREGRLIISETREEVALGRGDHIEIADATDARLVDVSIGDRISMAFEGKAGVVDMVQAGTRTDLRPTVLEYLYHNERLVFLWSALGIAWGLAWSVRRAVL